MRWAALVVLAAGCNEAFGLRPTVGTDAAFFDAPIDAPYRCPTGGAPRFDPTLIQYLTHECDSYAQVLAGRAVARCRSGEDFAVFEGPIDGALERAVGVDVAGTSQPRLSPDGQRMYVRTAYAVTAVVQQYTRSADGSWTRLADAPFTDVQAIGTVATAPTGDLLAVSTWTGRLAREWVNESGTWRAVQTHDQTTLGIIPDKLAMSSDGLRAVASSGYQAYYTDRGEQGAPFRLAAPVAGGPEAADFYLTDDCARLYAAGLGSVFYAQQP
jgi:hypothetical protein